MKGTRKEKGEAVRRERKERNNMEMGEREIKMDGKRNVCRKIARE